MTTCWKVCAFWIFASATLDFCDLLVHHGNHEVYWPRIFGATVLFLVIHKHTHVWFYSSLLLTNLFSYQALGNFYFIHKSVQSVSLWNFKSKHWLGLHIMWLICLLTVAHTFDEVIGELVSAIYPLVNSICKH